MFHTPIAMSIAGDIWNGLVEAIGKWFNRSTAEAIEQALGNLAFPTLDPQSKLLNLYDSFFGLGLLMGILVTAAYLVLVAWYATPRALLEAIKVIPMILVFGSLLPFIASLLTEFVHNLCEGMIEFITNSSYDESTFSFKLSGGFGIIDGLLARVGAFFLNLEFLLFSKYLVIALSVIVLVFAFRWLGAFGDGLFVVAVGVGLMLVFGPLASVTVLSVSWAVSSTEPTTPLGIMVPIVIAGAAPFVILFVYVKTGIAGKVRGVMESRQLSTKISRFSSGGSMPSSRPAKLGIAATAGTMFGIYLGRRGDQNSRMSQGAGRRDAASDAMSTTASALARTHPASAAALYVGSKVVRPPAKARTSQGRSPRQTAQPTPVQAPPRQPPPPEQPTRSKQK